jgi:ABC-type multidrug transport system fused ATPase/permease subunit
LIDCHAEEALGNVRTVKSFSAEGFEVARYSEKVNYSYILARKVAFAFGAFSGVAAFAANAAIILVLWYGGNLVIKGEMSTGTLTSFIIYTITVAIAMGAISALFGGTD